MSDSKMRAEFEVWAESRGLDLYCSRKDLYEEMETLWAWSAWKASRTALAFELPVIDEREWAVTSDECAAMREGIEIMARRIESSGFKVNRPPKPATPERACPGCGEKGFSANCMQCIPY